MKSIVHLWVLTGWLAATTVLAEEQIPWARDFQSACEMASEQRRLVLLHFYNDNCPPCLRVEQNVFSQPEVAEAVALNYVPVKVHAGKTPQLASRYQIMRWPTDVIVTPAGLEVYRAISPQKPADYIALVNQVASQTGISAGRQWKTELQPRMQRTGVNSPAPMGQVPASSPDSQNQSTAGQQRDAGPGQPSRSESTTPFQAASAAAPATSTTTQTSLRSSFVPPDSGAVSDVPKAPPAQANASAPPPNVASISAPLPTENPWYSGLPPTNPAAGGSVDSAAPTQTAIEPQPPALPQRRGEQQYFSATATEFIPPAKSSPPPPTTPVGAVAANQGPNLIPADQAPPLALGGHCAVTLVEQNTWQRANPLYGAIHEGQTYLFVTAAEQQRFLADPRRYAFPPFGLDGFCPVTLRDNMKWQKAVGQFFVTHRGRMYFFANAAAREKFLAAPDAYAPILSGCDPVRFAQRGELVEGKRSFGLITKEKQIYLFADQQSLETFEKSPAEYQDKVRQAMARSNAVMFR